MYRDFEGQKSINKNLFKMMQYLIFLPTVPSMKITSLAWKFDGKVPKWSRALLIPTLNQSEWGSTAYSLDDVLYEELPEISKCSAESNLSPTVRSLPEKECECEDCKRRYWRAAKSGQLEGCRRTCERLFLGQRVTLCFKFNPFPPSVPKWHRLAKLSILILEGIVKKFPMSVATLSR